MSALYRQRWTYCGVMAVPGCMALFLVNDRNRSTRAMVAYAETDPVRITEKS